MIDWRRKALSYDPKYYRWTQQSLRRLFLAGLAYHKKALVDWCAMLAREPVIEEGHCCERCTSPDYGIPMADMYILKWVRQHCHGIALRASTVLAT
jgi:leucyl-tRNA synthetase